MHLSEAITILVVLPAACSGAASPAHVEAKVSARECKAQMVERSYPQDVDADKKMTDEFLELRTRIIHRIVSISSLVNRTLVVYDIDAARIDDACKEDAKLRIEQIEADWVGTSTPVQCVAEVEIASMSCQSLGGFRPIFRFEFSYDHQWFLVAMSKTSSLQTPLSKSAEYLRRLNMKAD